MEKSCENNKSGRQLEARQWPVGESLVVNRSLSKRNIVTASLFGIFLVAVFLFIVLVIRFIDRIEIQLSERDQSIATKPFINGEVAQLKSQLVALVSGSINNRLQVLEAGIRDGNAGRGELLVVQALRNDFELLKSYAPKTLTRQEPGEVDGGGANRSKQYIDALILQEISYLKSILYFGIAFCGITVMFTGGMWLRAMYRFRKLEAQFTVVSPLLEKSRP